MARIAAEVVDENLFCGPGSDIIGGIGLEGQEIATALRLYGNHTEGKRRAARELLIGLATLYRKLEECQELKIREFFDTFLTRGCYG